MEKPLSWDFLLNCLIIRGILSSNPINRLLQCPFMRKTRHIKMRGSKLSNTCQQGIVYLQNTCGREKKQGACFSPCLVPGLNAAPWGTSSCRTQPSQEARSKTWPPRSCSNLPSSHIPQQISTQEDARPRIQKLLVKQCVANGKILLWACSKAWVQDENMTLALQMGQSHTFKVCVRVHRRVSV